MAKIAGNINGARTRASALWEALQSALDDKAVYDAIGGSAVGAYDATAFSGMDCTQAEFVAYMTTLTTISTMLAAGNATNICKIKA